MAKIGVFAFTFLTLVWASANSQAEVLPIETVELRGGGQVAGKVISQVERPTGGYVSVQVDDEIAIAIDQSAVTRVRTRDELEAYARRAAAAGDDPNKHYELGRWCKENYFTQQRVYHYQRAITLEPNHTLARANLGYVRDDHGNWIPYAVQQRDRGLVWANGGWQFPEAVAKANAASEAQVTAAKWIKVVAQLRQQYLGRSKKPQEAFEEITAIRDPLAANAIALELEGSRGKTIQPRVLRLEWVRLLGRFHTSKSVGTLVFTGLKEPDAVVREAAMEELKKYGSSSAIATFVPMLNPAKNSPKNVRLGLRGLFYFPRRELAFTYVDALVTTHMIVPPKGPGISTAFTDTGAGAGSFSTGSSNKPVPTPFKNMDALTLLKMIEPDVDYGFNQQAWREHFASQLTAYRGNLRRDP